MQTTTNIGLKTYEANDPTDWLGEFNYNMNKIDTAVGNQNEQIEIIDATASTAVTTANTASTTANTALTTANSKASIDDLVSSTTTTYSSDKINELISEIQPGTEIDDTVTSLTKTWSSSKINTELSTKATSTELSSKADKISYNEILSTELNFVQESGSDSKIYFDQVVINAEGYYYFDLLLGSSTGERCAFFEILENNTSKYSKYYYKNPITREVISDIIYIPAGHTIRIKALSTVAFTSNTTGNLIKVR